jgi:hypothetical protein
MTEFCNNNKYLPIRFTVLGYSNAGEPHHYGSVTMNTRDIEMLPDNKTATLLDTKGKPSGSLTFKQFDMDMRPSLLEYL